jgi:heat shock protein HslJ
MRKRRLLTAALSVSLLAAAVPGLAFAQDEGPYAAENLQWMLGSYADAEAMTDVPDEVEVTLSLSGGEAVGSAGCNSYFGSYEIDAESLTFGPLGSTLMLCQDVAQNVEDAYMTLLADVAGWSVVDKTMSLSDAAGAVTLVYAEAPVEVTGSDVNSLTAQLTSLQAQLDTVTDDVAALNLSKTNKRVKALEDSVAALQKKDSQFNNRIKATETAIADLTTQVSNLRKRIKALEEADVALDARVTALEEAAPKPEQPLP